MTLRNGTNASGVWSGWPVFGIARMQMDDRGAGFGGADRRFRDLARRDRQMGRHGRGVHGTGDGAGDDDFSVGHGENLYGWLVADGLAADRLAADRPEAGTCGGRGGALSCQRHYRRECGVGNDQTRRGGKSRRSLMYLENQAVLVFWKSRSVPLANGAVIPIRHRVVVLVEQRSPSCGRSRSAAARRCRTAIASLPSSGPKSRLGADDGRRDDGAPTACRSRSSRPPSSRRGSPSAASACGG